MQNFNRRKFLRLSTLASTAYLVPNFLKPLSAKSSLFPASSEGKVLVVIQLSGGNDGLNTAIPYRNDIYYSSRPNLSIAKNDVLLLNDELGLNPALITLKSLYDKGYLSIVNNVGYPNPDRSHFRSMDIWQTASGSDKYITTGWIGRFLDSECTDCENAYKAIELDDTLSLAMKGATRNGLATSDPAQLYRNTQEPYFKNIITDFNRQDDGKDTSLHYLYKTLVATESSAGFIYDKYKTYQTAASYPSTDIGRSLKVVGELIISGLDTKVYYLSLGSFDTHVNQQTRQTNLFKQLSEALDAFTGDLQKNNRFKDVLIMTFSEFGRRVTQNASNGTDHGTANNMFFISGALSKPGIFNDVPNLNDLEEGDLKYHVDFRSIYATVLNKWLGADDVAVLGNSFDKVNFV